MHHYNNRLMDKKIYLAPLQGFTDNVYRNAFHQIFKGVDKYFTPFIVFENDGSIRSGKMREVLPENNDMQNVVPQILVKDGDETNRMLDLLQELGHTTVNINLGCPFGPVVNRGRGSALLDNPDSIKDILKVATERKELAVSVKTRTGVADTNNFNSVIDIFNGHNLEEVIIHPRIATQQYNGEADFDYFASIADKINAPLFYNGDISTKEMYANVIQKTPNIEGVMIGRGILMNPFLAEEIKGIQRTQEEKRQMVINLHNIILERYSLTMSGDAHIMAKMTAFWSYFSFMFPEQHKVFKAIKKCKRADKYMNMIHPMLLSYV